MIINDINKTFTTFHNRFNKFVNKHAPIKIISYCKTKQFRNLWVTQGICESIKKKNKLLAARKNEQYELYSNTVKS